MQVLVSLANENRYERKCSLDEAKISPVFDRYMIDLYLIDGVRVGGGGGGGGGEKIDQGNELVCKNPGYGPD